MVGGGDSLYQAGFEAAMAAESVKAPSIPKEAPKGYARVYYDAVNRETENAIQLTVSVSAGYGIKQKEIWVPKSQITNLDKSGRTVDMKDWLYNKTEGGVGTGSRRESLNANVIFDDKGKFKKRMW